MNWPYAARLSLVGMVMGFATIWIIPARIEPLLWLPLLAGLGYFIARRGLAPVRHGIAVGLLNSVWITGAHILFFADYIARHPAEAEMMRQSPLADSPRLMMLVTGPVIGLLSGLIIGLLALIWRRFTPAPGAVPTAAGSAAARDLHQ